MAHVHRELGKLRLDVSAFTVPAQQALDREAVAQVVDAWVPSIPSAHPGLVHQFVQPSAQAGTGVAPALGSAVAQQRIVGLFALPTTLSVYKVASQFVARVARQRYPTGLVELGLPDPQDAVVRVHITELQAKQLATSKTSRVEQHRGQAQHLRSQARVGRRLDRARGHQHPAYLLGRNDHRRLVLMWPREAVQVRNKARRLRALAIQAPVAHDALTVASHVASQALMRRTPPIEGGEIEVGRSAGPQATAQ